MLSSVDNILTARIVDKTMSDRSKRDCLRPILKLECDILADIGLSIVIVDRYDSSDDVETFFLFAYFPW